MALGKAKQIEKYLSSFVRVSGFSALGTSDTVTTDVTTALSTAADNGGSVPVQQAVLTYGSYVEGVIVTPPYNRCEVYDSTTLQKIVDGSGNEVYARITFSSPNYVISYYTLVAGVETAYTFAATTIDFEFTYLFNFDHLPNSSLVGVKERNVADDGNSSGKPFFEILTVTALNTLSNLSFAPVDVSQVWLTVNSISTLHAGTNFTVTGQAFSFSGGQIASTGFDIETTDEVFAHYNRF